MCRLCFSTQMFACVNATEVFTGTFRLSVYLKNRFPSHTARPDPTRPGPARPDPTRPGFLRRFGTTSKLARLLWLRVHARLAEREVTSVAVVGTRDWSCADLF